MAKLRYGFWIFGLVFSAGMSLQYEARRLGNEKLEGSLYPSKPAWRFFLIYLIYSVNHLVYYLLFQRTWNLTYTRNGLIRPLTIGIGWCGFWCSIALLLCSGGTFAADTRNLAFGAHYKFEPSARYEFTQDAGDTTQLTDGSYVGGYFWTSRDAVGWEASGPIRIEIDLGATHSIDGICINTARGSHAGVAFPERVDMFVSSDSKQYKTLGDLYQSKPHADGPYLVQKFCASNLAAVGRFVMLGIQPRGSSVFLDEIEVLGGDNAVHDVSRPSVLLDRGSISDYLRQMQALRDRKEALLQLAIRMQANSANTSPEVRNRVKSFATQLKREPVADMDVLEKLQAELLDLHHIAVTQGFKEPLIVWRINPWARFTPIDSPSKDTVINSAIHLNMMRHGSISDAFILTNNSDVIQSFRIDAGMDNHGDVAPKIDVREVVPVVAVSHEVIGDALKPLINGAVSIKSGESKQLWMTLLSGESVSGMYTGKVSITSRQDNHLAKDVALSVKVWPVTFPEKQHVFVNAWSYLNWRPIIKFPYLAMQDLIAHHVNVFELDSPDIPWPNFHADGAYNINYARFDKALHYKKGVRRQLFLFGFNDESRRTFGGKFKFMSADWKVFFKKWMKDWVAHLERHGLTYQDYAFYPVDEPNGDEVGFLLDTARQIKEVDPNLQVLTTIDKSISEIDILRLSQVVDIFQMNVRGFSSFQKATLAKLGKEVWSYSANGGGKQADPLGYYRMQAWQAFRNDVTGIGFWAYADSGPSGTAWDDFDGTRPDCSVIYEDSNGPISSKRWEAWRQGVEDYELLTLARQKISTGTEMAEFKERIDSVISNPADFIQIELTRRYLLSVASK